MRRFGRNLKKDLDVHTVAKDYRLPGILVPDPEEAVDCLDLGSY